jgi:hypothetical protein
VALGIGIAAGGGGAYAVFASKNQAGTAILLVLSAIFLLIGIQGTSLIRFSTGSNTFELERRKRSIEKAAAELAKEDPDRAAGIIQGAEIALPALGSFSQSEALLYERRLETALQSLGYVTFFRGGPGDLGADFEVFRAEHAESKVYVEAKYRQSGILDTATARRLIERGAILRAPFLIVTNGDQSVISRAYASEQGREFPIRLVTWRNESDDRALRDALTELFGS